MTNIEIETIENAIVQSYGNPVPINICILYVSDILNQKAWTCCQIICTHLVGSMSFQNPVSNSFFLIPKFNRFEPFKLWPLYVFFSKGNIQILYGVNYNMARCKYHSAFEKSWRKPFFKKIVEKMEKEIATFQLLHHK